jgi:hypothetical protein
MEAMVLKWENQSAEGLVDAMLNLKIPENSCALQLGVRDREFVPILDNKVKFLVYWLAWWNCMHRRSGVTRLPTERANSDPASKLSDASGPNL